MGGWVGGVGGLVVILVGRSYTSSVFLLFSMPAAFQPTNVTLVASVEGTF